MKKILVIVCTVLSLIWFLYFENNSITITKFNIASSKIPGGFNGFRILQISDLHNKLFGKGQKHLVEIINNVHPDVIVITGDLIDRRHYNEDIAIELLEQIADIAPVYFVTGNHEWWSGRYEGLQKRIKNCGVKVLSDEKVELVNGEQKTYIVGIDDPAKYYRGYFNRNKGETVLKKVLEKLTRGLTAKDFTILLSHRPELFFLYSHNKIDLVFSGHTHGGQIRVPIIGGIITPDQGFFPKYASGIYREDGTSMIVSRGLGNSAFPQRLFNRPEIVVVTLKNEVN